MALTAAKINIECENIENAGLVQRIFLFKRGVFSG